MFEKKNNTFQNIHVNFPSILSKICKENNIEQRMYALRKSCEKKITSELSSKAIKETYICSLSSTKIVYKGLLTAEQLPKFYEDLNDNPVKSTFGLAFYMTFKLHLERVFNELFNYLCK